MNVRLMLSDLKFASRQLLKNPGFTAVAVLTLALGLGANSAIFSLVNSVLLRTVNGVRNPNQLLAFDFKPDGKPAPLPWFSLRDFVDFELSASNLFTGMAASRHVTVTLGREEQAEKTQALLVTPNWFDLLGTRFTAGRGFLAGEGKTPGAEAVAVISEGLWRRRFNTDPAVIGQTIELNDQRFTVVGVAAPFQVDAVYYTPEVWAPLTMHAQLDPAFDRLLRKQGGPGLLESDSGSVKWLARLKGGVALEQAQVAVELLARQLGEARGFGILAQHSLTVLPQIEHNRAQMERTAPAGVFLLAVAGMVLFIACANLANLMLARATARGREMAVRLALGAGRFRVIRQLLTEGVLLALLGGAAGLLLSRWTGDLLGRFIGAMSSRAMRPEMALDEAVLAYTLVLSMAAGVAFALAPAWRASRADLVTALKGEAGLLMRRARPFHLRNGLVVNQVAWAFLLLIMAGLFARGLQRARTMDLGFQPEGLLTMRIEPESHGIPGAEAGLLYERITERLSGLPGVREVSFAKFCQGDESTITTFTCERPGQASFFVWGNVVDAGHFQTLQTPVVRGRPFAADDLNGPPVVIVNEAFAQRHWPGEDALGQSIKISRHDSEEPGAVWAEVVGVAKNGQYVSLFENGRGPFLYQPSSMRQGGSMTLFVRAQGDHRALLPALRSELQALDDRLPVFELQPLASRIGRWRLVPQLGAMLVGAIGALGLLLAALGLYGTMACTVAQRTREFGVRLALGAPRKAVIFLVLSQGLRLVLWGSAIGLAAALAGTRFVTHLLFGISPLDAAAFAGGLLLLTLVALLASCVPAWRATKIDSMEALRSE